MSNSDLLKVFEEYSNLRQNIFKNFFTNSSIIFGNHKSGSTMLFNFLQVYVCTYLGKHHTKEWRTYQQQIAKSEYLKFNLGYNTPLSLDCALLTQHIFGDTDAITWDHVLNTVIKKISNEKSLIYFGFRGIGRNFLKYKTKLRDKNILVIIRDPRDCAVSAYFSYFKSHVRDQNSGLSTLIDKYQTPEINQFVKDDGIMISIRELNLVTAFLQPNLTIYKYEDFWFNKKSFCLDILNRLEMPIDEQIFLSAFNQEVDPPTSSNIRTSGHLRRGNPGEYKEKLSEETINFINKECAHLLEIYKYDA